MKTQKVVSICLCCCILFMGSVSMVLANERAERRDPFEPLLTPTPKLSEGPLPPEREPRTVLENYDLHQFRVIGIVVGELGHYAVILAPDGKSYMISVGTRIGKFDGEVIDISENVVLVKEKPRFLHEDKIVVKEQDSPLYLNPLEKSSEPESRFVILSDRP